MLHRETNWKLPIIQSRQSVRDWTSKKKQNSTDCDYNSTIIIDNSNKFKSLICILNAK